MRPGPAGWPSRHHGRARSRAAGRRPRRPAGPTPRASADRNNGGHPGVGRVTRQPPAIDVVVAQRYAVPAGHTRPRRREVLLRDLGRGVAVARVERSRLVDLPHRQRPRTHQAAGLEPARLEILHAPRRRSDRPMLGAGIATLAIHDHRRSQHQPQNPSLRRRREQHGRAEIVAAHIVGEVRNTTAEPDLRRLVAHGIDTAQGARDGGRVRDVTDLHLRIPGADEPRVDVDRSSRTRTRCPAPTRSSTTWDPMKPQPPVTRTCTGPPQIAGPRRREPQPG